MGWAGAELGKASFNLKIVPAAVQSKEGRSTRYHHPEHHLTTAFHARTLHLQ